jgi:hypothetical protein
MKLLLAPLGNVHDRQCFAHKLSSRPNRSGNSIAM